MIKLVVVDMDGTLLNSQNEISNKNKQAIKKLKDNQINFMLCTGRPLIAIKPYLEQLPFLTEGFVGGHNGAVIYDIHSQKEICHHSLTVQDLISIEKIATTQKVHLHYFVQDQLYTPNANISPYTVNDAYLTKAPLEYRETKEVSTDTQISKVMFIDTKEKLDNLEGNLPSDISDTYKLIRSSDNYLEVLNKQADKGTAIVDVANKLKLAQAEIIGIGDQKNDLALFEQSGTKVAMSNGVDELKKQADFITLSNDESGVAYAIDKLIFEGGRE